MNKLALGCLLLFFSSVTVYSMTSDQKETGLKNQNKKRIHRIKTLEKERIKEFKKWSKENFTFTPTPEPTVSPTVTPTPFIPEG